MTEGRIQLVLFSVEEANRLLPVLKPAVEALVQRRRAFDSIQARIDVLSLAAAGADPENPDVAELAGLLERRKQLGAEITKGIEAVQRHGVLVKDLEHGLVDFYALSGDRLVLLCWQLGEPEVAHWHTLQGGFAARQPLKSAELD